MSIFSHGDTTQKNFGGDGGVHIIFFSSNRVAGRNLFFFSCLMDKMIKWNCYITALLEINKFSRYFSIEELRICEVLQILKTSLKKSTITTKNVLLVWKLYNILGEGHVWILNYKQPCWILVHSFQNEFQKRTISLSNQKIYNLLKILYKWNQNDPNRNPPLFYPLLQWLELEQLLIPYNVTTFQVFLILKEKKKKKHISRSSFPISYFINYQKLYIYIIFLLICTAPIIIILLLIL